MQVGCVSLRYAHVNVVAKEWYFSLAARCFTLTLQRCHLLLSFWFRSPAPAQRSVLSTAAFARLTLRASPRPPLLLPSCPLLSPGLVLSPSFHPPARERAIPPVVFGGGMAIAPFGASLLVRELRCGDDGFETLPEHALSRFFSAQSSAPVSAGNGCLLVEGGAIVTLGASL